MRHFSRSAFALWLSKASVTSLSRLMSALVMTLIVTSSHLPVRSQPTPIIQTNDQLRPEPSVKAAEQLKNLEAAYVLVTSSEDTIFKIEKLGKLAKAYSELGNQARALELLEQASLVAGNVNSFSYPRLLTSLAFLYNNIGEVETAVSLIEQAIDLVPTIEGQYNKSIVLGDIAEAYAYIEDSTISEDGLSAVLDHFAKMSGLGEDTLYFTLSLAEAYEQLADPIAASEGLSRLMEIALNNVDKPMPDDSYSYKTTLVRDRSVILSAIAKAYAKQNNVEAATVLLAQAIETIAPTYGVGDHSEAISMIAVVYGYLPNTEAVQTGLAKIATLVVDSPLEGPYTPFETYNILESSKAIAAAYASIGDQTNAKQVADAAAEVIQANEYGRSKQIVGLGLLSDIYKAAGDTSSQQSLIQQSYELVLTLEPDEALQSRVVNTLSSGYRETIDDKTAKTLFKQLESFVRKSDSYQNNPSQAIFSLALAAHYRGDEVEAQLLLTEATEALKFDSSLEQSVSHSVIIQIIAVYNRMQNEQARRAGLKTIGLIVDDSFTDLRFRQKLENALVEAYAGI